MTHHAWPRTRQKSRQRPGARWRSRSLAASRSFLALTGGKQTHRNFPGQWFQSESGLFQNWMRDYDPEMDRYMQPDPLGLVWRAPIGWSGLNVSASSAS
ncbi:MAG: RHS repeat-associated core domain-containing protein, partial [Marinibacterium sp.]